jgi:HicB family
VIAVATFTIRLPSSLKAEASALSKASGVSLNEFVVGAVAEKIAARKAAAFFEVRAVRARSAVRRGEPSPLMALLARRGGEPPREGDELPEGYKSQAPRALPVRKRTAYKPQAALRRTGR